jgi:hypothetical protein
VNAREEHIFDDELGPIPWEPDKDASDATKARDRRRMIRRLREILDDIDICDLAAANRDNVEATEAWFKAYGPQLRAFEHGDVEPLRRALPGIAKAINLPRRADRSKWPKPRRQDCIDGAARDVRRIRALWKKHYGHVQRPRGDDLRAEQIAADLWGVTIDDIERRMK